MKEQWKWVVGYAGYYQVSDHGRIRSVDRSVRHQNGHRRKLKGQVKKLTPLGVRGYLGVSLCRDGVRRMEYVHRVVAAAWLGSKLDTQYVEHGSGGKFDNSIGNIWYRPRRPHKRKIKRRIGSMYNLRAVRRSDSVEFVSLAIAAEKSGCFAGNISMVCQGKRHTTGGYGWTYIDDPEDST